MGNLPHGTIRKPAGGFRPLTREDAGEFPVPGAFGPYRVMHQVGTGVLGPVYLARESDGDRAVAIKSFHLDLTPEQVEVFANALAHIVNVEASHPAIVAPLAAGLESGTPFMAYEYVEAESLDVVLRREGRPAEGLAWISALADAVDAAHALGLVHGALHLRDVLVTSEGVCATGFGIASALEHVQLGFPVRRPYTAPEVMAGRRWGPPADRFAVAVLAYELLTGTRPSAAGDEAIADLVDLQPDVADPAGLQQAFRNALAEDPGIRSASAAGFVAALARAIGDESYASRPAAAHAGTAAFAAGSVQESAEDRPAAQHGEDGHGDYEPSFGSPHEPDAAGSEGGATGRAPTPPVQIALPDALGGPDEQDAGAGTAASDDDGGSRGARSRQPAHPPRSKRRPPYRSEPPRRSGPVVAVRDEVQWDPLDEPRAAPPSTPGPAYGDDHVPHPPGRNCIAIVEPRDAPIAVR
ncbi:MAG: protein kinase, partial [Acidobacteria bacterium]|nr:protein kinase [Acidobacteriota bacterium]